MAVTFSASPSPGRVWSPGNAPVVTVCALMQGWASPSSPSRCGVTGRPWARSTCPRSSPVAASGQALQLPLYYRIVLAADRAARAGVGSGLTVTAQQSCLALGVATLGSLFLALAPAAGMRNAFAIVLGVQLAGLVGLARC